MLHREQKSFLCLGLFSSDSLGSFELLFLLLLHRLDFINSFKWLYQVLSKTGWGTLVKKGPNQIEKISSDSVFYARNYPKNEFSKKSEGSPDRKVPDSLQNLHPRRNSLRTQGWIVENGFKIIENGSKPIYNVKHRTNLQLEYRTFDLSEILCLSMSCIKSLCPTISVFFFRDNPCFWWPIIALLIWEKFYA